VGAVARSEVMLPYGKAALRLSLDADRADWHVYVPRFAPALADPDEAFTDACRAPLGTAPLAQVTAGARRVVIVTSDGTRPVPNRWLIPRLLRYLAVSPEHVTILIGNGTHRPHPPHEIRELFGAELAARFTIRNHDAFSPAEHIELGRTPEGVPIRLNRHYVEADRRIILGYIEPHFFAGFSGGAKAVVPGLAAAETIFHVHRAALISQPKSTWGTLHENPIRREIAAMVEKCPPDFCVNVTLNDRQEITGFFAGDYRGAHAAGCDYVRSESMTPVPRRYPVVITTNNCFPLNQNLYQTVKGISAAAQIIEPGGAIFVLSACSDGIPAHGRFAEIMRRGASPAEVLDWIHNRPETVQDQWQAQILAEILQRCPVYLHSELPPEAVEACKLIPFSEFPQAIFSYLADKGKRPPVAVLPHGPVTIPYLSDPVGNPPMRRS